MKKLLFFLFTLVVLASGCGKKNTFTLQGSIKGLPSDTILVFYQEPDYKLDTILLSKGKFTYTITPDTFTIFSLLLGEKQILPIYADKGESVTLNGMVGEIEVKGKGENAQLAKHIQYLNTLGNNKTAVMAAVDSLIKTNPHSYSNIYLIDKYYVQDSLPDYNHIDQLIKGLSGIIKDTPYIIDLQNKLSEKKRTDRSSLRFQHLVHGQKRKDHQLEQRKREICPFGFLGKLEQRKHCHTRFFSTRTKGIEKK